MRKVVSFMHISLDGYATDENGGMDWILVDEEMFEYASDRTKEADTALYGRKTYEIMENYWPTAADQPNPTKHDIEHAHWYNQVAKVIVSRTLTDTERPHTAIISENLPDEIRLIKRQKGREIIMFGSPSLTHSLMDENLVDDLWLFINPIILGKGIQLFKNPKNKIHLHLLTSKSFASGVVCLHYEIKPGE
ncbi:MAG TPA: dihydrofolate reductase family protein [Prolixibacteraceae bacterium]|jgi:dihydrofolate reductase